jgi:hypothetical protein
MAGTANLAARQAAHTRRLTARSSPQGALQALWTPLGVPHACA